MNAIHRVLITGGSGFVGSHIVPVLLSHGCQVVAVDRVFDTELQQEWQETWGQQINCIESDLTTLPSDQVNAVIHAAAITASPEEAGQTPEDNFRANLNPLLTVLEWVAQHKVQRAIFLSSSAVFRATPPAPISEEAVPWPSGLYAIAKQTMENLIETLNKDYKRDVVVVRLSNIYGLNEHARPTRPRVSLVGQMVDTALQTGKLTIYNDSPARDWTFAPDVGQAIYYLLQAQSLKQTLYNVASEQTFTSLDIARELQTHIPGLAVKVNEGSDPAAPLLTRRGWLSSQRLRAEINFNDWTPFADGIQQILDYRRQVEAVQ